MRGLGSLRPWERSEDGGGFTGLRALSGRTPAPEGEVGHAFQHEGRGEPDLARYNMA